MRAILLSILLSSVSLAFAQQRPRFHFNATNPDVHDPVMAREDGRYYIFATGMYLSSMHSDNMKTWTIGRPVMPEIPQWAMDSVPGYRGHTWAPDIQRVGDTWYMYYSCSTFGKNGSAIGLMTSKSINPDSPDYGWQDRGVVVKSTPGVTDWNAIDPNMILDEEGNPWLAWGSFWDGIQLVRLEKDFLTPIGEPQTIARRYLPKNMLEQLSPEDRERAAQAPNAGANAIEAPFLIREGDYYYLFASWDYCCKGANSNYKTVGGRSHNIEGPYLDRSGKPMTEGGGEIIAQRDEQYYGVGHTSAYKFDGQWYFMAHGYSVADDGMSKLVIKKMRFDADGWPVLEESADKHQTMQTVTDTLFDRSKYEHTFAFGADISWLTQQEQWGTVYRNRKGEPTELMQILQDEQGINAVRFRVWVNPRGGWSGKDDVINLCKRAHAKGLMIMVGFHYSDSWADPEKQTIPAKWTDHSLEALCHNIYDHTHDVLSSLKAIGITPQWVQIGNETYTGMLWETGRTGTKQGYKNFAAMINSGYRAIKDVDPGIQAIIHLPNAHNNKRYREMFDQLKKYKAQWDIIGMSAYPHWSKLSVATPDSLAYTLDKYMTNIRDMKRRYGKPVMIVETGHYNNKPVESNQFLVEFMRQLIAEGILGCFFWEPESMGGYELGAWNPQTHQASIAMDAFKGIRHRESKRNE